MATDSGATKTFAQLTINNYTHRSFLLANMLALRYYAYKSIKRKVTK